MNDLILYATEDGRSQLKSWAQEPTVWLMQLDPAGTPTEEELIAEIEREKRLIGARSHAQPSSDERGERGQRDEPADNTP